MTNQEGTYIPKVDWDDTEPEHSGTRKPRHGGHQVALDVALKVPCVGCEKCAHDNVEDCLKHHCYCCGREGGCGDGRYVHYADFEPKAQKGGEE